MEHFGIKLTKRKYSFVLKRDEFALINTKPSLPIFKSLVERNAYTDSNGNEYRMEWCEEYRELCLKNYDLNMEYFKRLDRTGFDYAIAQFLKRHKKFQEIGNLYECDNVSGYYMMVLDEYKQVYIGKSEDMKKRIQSHWTKTKAFDRTLFPMYAVNSSCFSIDFFRALDTTRIFVWKRELVDGVEQKLIDDFPQLYCSNRIGGDITLAIEALETINKRHLVK